MRSARADSAVAANAAPKAASVSGRGSTERSGSAGASGGGTAAVRAACSDASVCAHENHNKSN